MGDVRRHVTADAFLVLQRLGQPVERVSYLAYLRCTPGLYPGPQIAALYSSRRTRESSQGTRERGGKQAGRDEPEHDRDASCDEVKAVEAGAEHAILAGECLPVLG